MGATLQGPGSWGAGGGDRKSNQMKILFVTPFHFATQEHDDEFDHVLSHGLKPYLPADVELVVEHLPRPRIDGPAFFQEESRYLMRAAVAARERGFDAFVIGCCYDPLLTDVRAALAIPVIGPLETAAMQARQFGHKFAIVTDIKVAEPRIADLVRLYGLGGNCAGVTSIGWDGDDILDDRPGAARAALEKATQILETTDAEVVVIGCTIVSSAYEEVARSDSALRSFPVLNTNLLAVTQAQSMATLASHGQYRMARTGYYA